MNNSLNARTGNGSYNTNKSHTLYQFFKTNIIFIFSGNISTHEIQRNHIKNDKLRVICLKENEEKQENCRKFKKKILCTHTKKISFHVFLFSWGIAKKKCTRFSPVNINSYLT